MEVEQCGLVSLKQTFDTQVEHRSSYRPSLDDHNLLNPNTGRMNHFTILALDLEGTLISNAMSQIPRPGLFTFLERCRELFPRVVMFTTVNEDRFRMIARLLVEENVAPPWFSEMEYVTWKGQTKDLACIPDANVQKTLLVDDFEVYVHPGQELQWVKVDYFDYPYDAQDAGLLKVLDVLEQRLGLPIPARR